MEWMIARFVCSFAAPEIQTFLPGIGDPIFLVCLLKN
jgi:hypothetical protein